MARRRNADLHGNAPDASPVALLIVDAINDLEFEGGAAMLPRAVRMARAIAALKRRTTSAGIPAIYVNDNFGRWRSDFRRIVSHCLQDGVRGQPVVELLVPDDDDYFVLKPKHSGFHSTSLDVLLAHLGVQTLILTGLAGDFCVLLTAHDAYMRDYRLFVPGDCVASDPQRDNESALQHMRKVCKADTTLSTALDLERLVTG